MKLHLPTGLRKAIASLFAAIAVGTLGTATLHATELSDAILTLEDFSATSISSAEAAGWEFTNVTAGDDGVFYSTSSQGVLHTDTDWATQGGASNNRALWSAIVQVDGDSLLNAGSSGTIFQSQLSTPTEGAAFSGGKLVGAWNNAPWTNLTIGDKTLEQCVDGAGSITIGIQYLGDGGTSLFIVDGQKKVYSANANGLKGGGNPPNLHMDLLFTSTAGIGYESLYLFGNTVDATSMTAMLQSLATEVKSDIFTWNGKGTSAAWDTVSENWLLEGSPATYQSKALSKAVFGTAAPAKQVTVDTEIIAGTVEVQDAYTFVVSSTLTIDTLTATGTGSATMSGGGYITISSIAAGSNLVIGENTRVNTGDISVTAAAGTLASGEGTLVVNKFSVSGGSVTVASGLEVNGGGDGKGNANRSAGFNVTGADATVDLLGNAHLSGALYAALGTVNIGNGTDAVRVETNRVEFGDTAGNGTSTLNVKENATLHVKAGDTANAYSSTGLIFGEWGGVSVANIAGKLYADQATASVGDNMVTFNIQEGGLMAVKGFAQNQTKDKTETINLNLLDGGTLVMGANGITNQKPVIINFAAGEVGISDYGVEIAKDVTLSGSGTKFNTAVYTWVGSEDTLELETGEAGGALTVSGNITGDGSLIKAGDGTLTLSGTANKLTHTVDLQKGELVLSGTFDVTALASGGGTGDYVDGDNDGNGFLQYGVMTAHVVDIADGATVSGEGTFTANGAVGTFDTATGNVSFKAGVTYTTLYVNVDGTTESLDHAITASSGEMTEAILKNNTTLALDSADAVLPQLTLAADADAALNVTANTAITKATGAAEGHTLTINGTAGSTLTIGATGADSYAGAGTLVIAEGATVLLRGNNTNFTGNIEVNGTLMVGTGINANVGTGVFGAENIAATSTRTFTINSTGVLDLNGQPDTKYAYVLAGGKITNSGQDIGESKAQMSGLKLTANSTVEAGTGHEYWLLSAAYAPNTLDLGGNTLVKTGDGRFGFKTTSISTGTLEAREGVIHFSNSNTVANMLLSGGTFTGGVDVKGDITVHATVGADMSAALNIAEAGKVITFDVDADQTLNQTGMVNGAGSIVKNGDGILVMSGAAGTTTPGTLTGVQVNAGTLKVTAANVLGSGPITVAAGATLDMTAGNVLAGTQTVTNSGNVIIHNTLTSGTVNGGSLILAGDFPTTGELLDVDGLDTGNGFSQGGTIKVYDPTKATLDVTEIKHGDNTYHMADLTDGVITLGGADWSVYQLKVANINQPTIGEIMAWADQKGGATGTLKSIVVSANDLDLVDDVDSFKTSMLSGENLAEFTLTLVDTALLTMDADVAGQLALGGTDSDAEATIVLTKDCTVGSSLFAYSMEANSNLKIKGAYTLSAPMVGTMGGSYELSEGAKLQVTTNSLGLVEGDGIVVKDTAELLLPGISVKSVDGAKTASLQNETDQDAYDIGSTGYSLTDARITISFSDAAHNFGHELKGTSSLVNAGTASVNDINALNTAYDELHAQNGDIYLSGRTSGVAVRNLTLGEGRGVYMNGSDQTITVNGTASLGSGAKVSSALTMAANSTLNGTASLENHALSLDGGIKISNDLWSTISALDPEESTNIFTGVSALTLAGAKYSEDVDLNTIFTHASLKANKYMLGFKDGNVVITKNLENNRYWKGGSGSWNTTATNLWTDEEGGADATFVNGYNAHFTSASGGVITLGADITADSITVSGADYIFSPGTYSLTVNKSVEADAHKATFNMALSGTGLKLIAKNGGTITLAIGGSVKDVEIGTGSSLEVSSATLTVADGFVNNGSLDAETLILSQGTAQGGNVNAGTLNLASGQSYTFGNLNAATISGTGADLTIGDGATLNAATAATLKSLTTGDSAQLGGNIIVAGATNIGGATLTGSLTTGTLTGGPLSVSGGHLTLASGSLYLVQFAGTSSLTASGAITLDGALQNYGDLTLTGTYDASNLPASKSDSKYVEGGTPGNGNGFEQARLTLTIVNGGTTSANDATIVYRTKTLTEKVGTDGKVTFDGDVDYTKFYVNTGIENASTAMNNAKWTSASSFVLNSNTTLVVDHEGISLGMVNMPAGAALLQIESGYTVATDGSSKNLMLTGAGELAVDAGKDTPGVVYHASQWTGTVSLRDVELTQLDSDWGTANSTVALQNASGALGNAEVKYDLELRKGAVDSWGYGGTSSTKDSHLWLNGDLKGDGDLGVKSGTATSIFELNGNTAAWTGNFIVATNADVTLSLGGDAKTINGSVSGSNLTLKLKTDATLKSDSTVARVNATAGSLKVDAGKTLTVTDTILPDNIKLGAGASIVAAFMGGTEYGYMDGTIANKTGGDQAVSINNADITVTGATLCTGGGTGFTVDNKLVDAKLLVAETLTKAVALNNVQDSLEVVDDLAIGAGGSLKVANGGSKQELAIGGGTTLTLADGTTLDANVAIGSGATLTLNYNTGGTPAATTLNSGSLALANGLTLSGNVYNQLAAFTDADDNTVVDLFQGVGALTLGGSAYSEEVKASQYFTNLGSLSDLGDYTLLYNDSTDTVSIRFNITDARTLTWNGTEGNSTWEVGEGTAENWLDTTPEETHFMSGDNALFTNDAAKKQVTIAEDITARNISVTDARYLFENEADHTITADQFSIQGSTLSKKGAGELVLDIAAPVSVKDASFEVQAGSVVIGTPDKPGTLELTGSVLDIASDASLTVATIHADAGPTMELGGTLTVANGSLVYLTALDGSTLRIADVGTTTAGTLTVGADTYLHGLENHGTLDLGTHELTLKQAAAQGGNVTAGNLKLAENGNTFGDLKVNSILYAYGAHGAGTLGAVTVDTITANGAGTITLDLTDVRGDGGSLAPIQRTGGETTYTLIHANGQTLDAGSFTLDAATLEALVQNGLIHEGAGLTVTENDVKLTIGGQDLTWYTSKDTTEWGYKVMNGDEIAHGANTLNGVQHVVVDEDRTIDVTSVADDAVLRVRNITGAANKTITFTGEHSDAVALIATEDTSSDVNVAAKHILLGVGLPETDDIDPIEYDADLHVGSVKLTDALLVVTNDASFSVDRLNGDEDSMISGAVAIEGQGGAYRGEYAGAAITVVEDAEATLYAGESLKLYGEGTVKLMYTKSTEIDGVNADGMTLILNNPNASIIGSTLTMQDESGLTNGTLVFGMSAIESAKRIDSIQTPQIIEGSLVLGDGTTVVVNQDDLADSGIAMVVNNGRTYRNLALAYIGNEETYTDSVLLNGYLYGKYYKNARIEAGELLVDMRDDFYQDLTKATTPNGRAGAGMLDDALRELNPQAYEDTWSGDLATVMTALESVAIPQRSADRVAAAMSGASAAAMGAAWSHDVDRQLRAIRNRTTSMGVANCEVNEDMPYFNAWVNAEGDYSKLSADGTLAGYKLSSWGGTLGFDVDFTPAFTAGLALTVMKGDYTAESADVAKGDLDRLYVTVFGRYTHRAWTHTLVATFGTADTKLERTVNYGVGSYRTNADSDGRAFGIMYEAGYAKALNEDGSTCIQPMVNLSYRTSSLSGYTEKGGSDAALKVGEAKANVFTAALGARLQTTIGTSVYNRASIFEGRVLVKGDAGDRDVAVNNAFTGVRSTRKVKSAELGAFGVEVGAGVIIPLGESAGSLFLDASGEFRNKYTEINGTVGYRFNF